MGEGLKLRMPRFIFGTVALPDKDHAAVIAFVRAPQLARVVAAIEDPDGLAGIRIASDEAEAESSPVSRRWGSTRLGVQLSI